MCNVRSKGSEGQQVVTNRTNGRADEVVSTARVGVGVGVGVGACGVWM